MISSNVVVVTGTGTDVGKTWVTAALITTLRSAGTSCAARKPAQSFDSSDASPRDADVLAAATGEQPSVVCPTHRWYPTALAPPMAAALLHLASFNVSDLIAELAPTDAEFLFIEGAGGLRSPIAADGDTLSLIEALQTTHIVVVAHAELGTINSVLLTTDALRSAPLDTVPKITVFLNRFDAMNTLHQANLDWLNGYNTFVTLTTITELAQSIVS